VQRLQAEGEKAFLTDKREIENYYHCDAIRETYELPIPEFGNDDCVAEIVARAVHNNARTGRAWDELDDKAKESKMSHVKKRLAKDALPRMTYERFAEADPAGLIVRFLREVGTSRDAFING
jgi:hypothetical protein